MKHMLFVLTTLIIGVAPIIGFVPMMDEVSIVEAELVLALSITITLLFVPVSMISTIHARNVACMLRGITKREHMYAMRYYALRSNVMHARMQRASVVHYVHTPEYRAAMLERRREELSLSTRAPRTRNRSYRYRLRRVVSNDGYINPGRVESNGDAKRRSRARTLRRQQIATPITRKEESVGMDMERILRNKERNQRRYARKKAACNPVTISTLSEPQVETPIARQDDVSQKPIRAYRRSTRHGVDADKLLRLRLIEDGTITSTHKIRVAGKFASVEQAMDAVWKEAA